MKGMTEEPDVHHSPATGGATDDDLARWRSRWADLMDIEVVPLIDGAAARRQALGDPLSP